jgi:spermidine synthase
LVVGSYPDLLLYLLFFLSGISGLIYQVVWVRVFGNVFGNTVYSASLVIAVFMLGLGAGSYLAGRWSDRRYAGRPDLPLRVYGYFEAAIAALGLAIALLLPHLDALSVLVTSYHQEANGWFAVTPASYAARVAIAAVLLTPITMLMGGTLTLLIRHLVRADVEADARRITFLYAVNTAGAAVGCWLTDFAFVPAIGLFDTQMVAVGLNLVAGVGAVVIAKSQIPTPKSQAPNRKSSSRKSSSRTANPESRLPTPDSRLPTPVLLTAAALALSGFSSLGMEIVWFRHFSIMLGAFRAVFSLLLTVMLVAIGAGAFAASVIQRRVSGVRAGQWLLVVQALLIAATLAGIALADSSAIDLAVSGNPAFRAANGDTDALITQSGLAWQLAELWFNLRPMLPEIALPALLMGFSFPLANALVQRAEESVGRRAGALYLANTLGAVAGSLVTGFLLLPFAGLQGSTTALMFVAAAGLVPLFLAASAYARRTAGYAATREPATRRVFAIAAVLIATAAIAAWLWLPRDYITTRALPRPAPGERILDQSEGVNEIVTVTESIEGRRLMTNGHPMSATWPLSQRYMRALAHVPLLSMDNPQRVLVIGFGVGNTTAAATLHPSITRVDVADLSRNVLGHAGDFAGSNGNVLKDPRVSVYVNDGRHHLLMQPPGTYDLIALEPPPIGYAGVAALYSEEFYALARTRLTPHGFISQWLPSYQVPAETTLSMIKSFVDVFPQSVLLSGAQADLILIGANDRIEIDPGRLFAALSQRPGVHADLARLDLGQPSEIVGMFLGSARKLADATRNAVPVTDDRPVQEYGVRSLLNLGEFVPGSVVDLSGVPAWCPKCFENGMPTRLVAGLDLYLALLNRAYAATPTEGARTRALAEHGRLVAGSAYLGAVVPDTADVHNDLGIALAERGQIDAAIAEFRQALQLDPRSAPTLWHLGSAFASKGDLAAAADYLRTSVQLDPANADARHDLDTVLALQRQHERFP